MTRSLGKKSPKTLKMAPNRRIWLHCQALGWVAKHVMNNSQTTRNPRWKLDPFYLAKILCSSIFLLCSSANLLASLVRAICCSTSRRRRLSISCLEMHHTKILLIMFITMVCPYTYSYAYSYSSYFIFLYLFIDELQLKERGRVHKKWKFNKKLNPNSKNSQKKDFENF